jgi:hypothetical protein
MNTLDDANLKLGSALSNSLRHSGRASLKASTGRETSSERLADLAQGNARRQRQRPRFWLPGLIGAVHDSPNGTSHRQNFYLRGDHHVESPLKLLLRAAYRRR